LRFSDIIGLLLFGFILVIFIHASDAEKDFPSKESLYKKADYLLILLYLSLFVFLNLIGYKIPSMFLFFKLFISIVGIVFALYLIILEKVYHPLNWCLAALCLGLLAITVDELYYAAPKANGLNYQVELKEVRVVNGQNCRQENGAKICQVSEFDFYGTGSSTKMLNVNVENFYLKEEN